MADIVHVVDGGGAAVDALDEGVGVFAPDAVNQLSEPRENSYMVFCRNEGITYQDQIRLMLKNVGSVKTSKTFPSLCRATMETSIANLETTAKIQTIDYNGKMQDHGGDPITAEVIDEKGNQITTKLYDNEDGSYSVKFTAKGVGTFCMKVNIFKGILDIL